MRPTETTVAPVSAAPQKRLWHSHPTVRFLSVVAVLLGFYVAYGYMTGPWRITSRLQACLAQRPASAHIQVTAKFPPEEFHIRIYQQVGSLRGVTGHTATLHTVTPAHVRFLSRYYWIQQIDLIGERSPATCIPPS